MKKTENDLSKKTVMVSGGGLILLSLIPLLILIFIPNIHFIIKLILFMLFCFLFLPAIGLISGNAKAKKELKKKEKQIKLDNPYLYFRELPNKYGIGISSILMDSAIEDYKDIVAVILDLCARKYLFLKQDNDKYKIQVLKDIDQDLLSNEAYVMQCVINNTLSSFDYKHWYKLCIEDSNRLGLYNVTDLNNFFAETSDEEDDMKSFIKKWFRVVLILSSVIAILSAFTNPWYLLTVFIWVPIIALPTYLIMNVLYAFKFIGKETKGFKNKSYKQTINDKLSKTEKGISELHKLYAYEKFIKEFGDFVSKKPEEVVLWDHYLSYAVMFGATKDILKNGYSKIVQNGSFMLKDVDNINLNNIVTEKL